jgi:hypothetical protein
MLGEARMNLTLLAVLVLTAALAWWLSGHDPLVTGENKPADIQRRAWRCGATLLLVWAGAAATIYGGIKGGFLLVAVALPLAILWAGCLSDVFARALHQLIDPDDKREFDPQRADRELDRLAALVRTGQHEEAIQVCSALLKSGEVSALSMETLLFHMYGQLLAEERLPSSSLLSEADQLCRAGRGREAASRLKQLLRNEPQNLGAVLMQLRMTARDLARRDEAEALLRTIECRPGWPPGFIDYARQSLREWINDGPRKEKCAEGIESLLVDKKYSQPPTP